MKYYKSSSIKVSQKSIAHAIEVSSLVLFLSKKFDILYANDAFLSFYKLSREQLVASHCYEITHSRTSPCIGTDHGCPVAEILDGGEDNAFKHVHTGCDGGQCVARVTAYPVKNAEETDIGFFVYLIEKDIENIEKTNEEKVEMLSRILTLTDNDGISMPELKQKIFKLSGSL